ncbi:MAG: protein-disulfide reductase DsbD N-terminal domain-containing protein, partial [Acidobacteriota bacterium]|nr:protein-disulfide reductase DsbD N-terminal domain-containing protein [Acidobacteriota bacterium]
MKRCAIPLMLCAWSACAEMSDHVKWSLEIIPPAAAPGGKVLGHLTAKIDPGWHLYSLSTPPGPIPTTIKLADQKAIERFRILQPKPVRKFDPNFNADTETYEAQADFLIELELRKDAPAGVIEITAEPRYQVCSDKSCIPPVTRKATATLNVDPGASAAAITIPPDYAEPKARPLQSGQPASVSSGESIFAFLAVAFGFGLAAIFT